MSANDTQIGGVHYVTNAEKCQRWRKKQRIPKVNSVWALGDLAAL